MKPTFYLLASAVVALSACTSPAPGWDARFGDAVRQVRANQVIDPQASTRNVTPPVIDSKATAGAQTKYSTSYDYAVKEVKQPALVIESK
jgi:hypothetical protein